MTRLGIRFLVLIAGVAVTVVGFASSPCLPVSLSQPLSQDKPTPPPTPEPPMPEPPTPEPPKPPAPATPDPQQPTTPPTSPPAAEPAQPAAPPAQEASPQPVAQPTPVRATPAVVLPTPTPTPTPTETPTPPPAGTPTAQPTLQPTDQPIIPSSSTPTLTPLPGAFAGLLASGGAFPWWGAALLLAAVLVVAATGTVVTRALVYTRRDLRLKELMLARDAAASISAANVVDRLGQLAFDASGEHPDIDQVLRVVGTPIPAVLTLGREFATYVFTPAPPRTFRQHQANLFGGPMKEHGRFRIDANTSGPTALHELRRIWELVAAQFGVAVQHRALPRARQWWLYVVAPPGAR